MQVKFAVLLKTVIFLWTERKVVGLLLDKKRQDNLCILNHRNTSIFFTVHRIINAPENARAYEELSISCSPNQCNHYHAKLFAGLLEKSDIPLF